MASQQKHRPKYPGHVCIVTITGSVQVFRMWMWMVRYAHMPKYLHISWSLLGI